MRCRGRRRRRGADERIALLGLQAVEGDDALSPASRRSATVAVRSSAAFAST